jgi:hypothetical protein
VVSGFESVLGIRLKPGAMTAGERADAEQGADAFRVVDAEASGST